MNIEILSEIVDLTNYENDLKEILDELKNDNPFLTFDWMVHWWNCFGEDHELLFLVMKTESIVAGLCPFMITKKKFIREVSFIGCPQAGYMDIIAREEYREELIRQLCLFIENMKGSFIFNLQGISETSPNLIALKACLQCGGKNFFIKIFNSYLIQPDGQNFDSYFKSRCKHNSLKDIQRREQRLCELGTLTWQRQESDELNVIFDIHNKRWLKKNDGSGFSSVKSRAFFQSLAQDGEVSAFHSGIYTLRLDDRIIGFTYVFECSKKIVLYRLAHDVDFTAYSPGKIIVKNIIKTYCDGGFEIFDFMKGDEKYKENWATDKKSINSILFSTNSFAAKLRFKLCHITEKIKLWLKKQKLIVSFKKTGFGRLKYLFSKNSIQLFKKRIHNKKINEGLFVIFQDVVRKCYKKIYDRADYILLNPSLSSIFDRAGKELSIRPFILSELERLGNLMNCNIEDVTKRFYNGHKCFFLASRDQIIGYVWLCFSGINIGGKKYMFSKEKDSACIYELFVCKAYKKIIPWALFLNVLFQYLLQNSISEIYIRLKLLNNKAYRSEFEVKDSFSICKPFYRKEYLLQKQDTQGSN